MNILLVGGSSSFMNNMIVKFKKEGHKVYLLSGNRYGKEYYQKVFERYDFPYDCQNLDDIFESVHPDVVIYSGIYDTNYRWHSQEKDGVRYLNGLNSLLMSFKGRKHGKFIYISSEEVYASNFTTDIKEGTPYVTAGAKSLVAAQAEELVRNYHTLADVDAIIMRLGSMFSIPESTNDCTDICSKLTYEAAQRHRMTVRNRKFAPLFETDAISRIYTLAGAPSHRCQEYNVAGNMLMSEEEVARIILATTGETADIVPLEGNPVRCKLDSDLFDSEFGSNFYCDLQAVLKRSAETVHKNKFRYRDEENKEESKAKKKTRAAAAARAVFPFLENILGFIITMALVWVTRDVAFVQKIDLFLIYVLIFAMVYGQNQAILSGVLSMVGYYLLQISDHSSADVIMNATTYIWIAEIFILGLSVGFLHDRIEKGKKEHEAESVFYNMQLSDMKDINTSNVRVKDALETQIVNQSDSVGKIYSITSSLNQYSPEEVLFYAAEMIGKLTKSKDVAIYTVSNKEFARLFSFTSKKAQVLGNSIRYADMGEMSETLKDKKVFINRKLDERYPLMASAVFDNDGNMQLIIMIWTISWENMTLGQANQLVVIGALIQNAVVRATRYLDALEEKRYVKDTRALEPEAFESLRDAYLAAGAKGLTECLLLKCTNVPVVPDPEEPVYLVEGAMEDEQTEQTGETEEGEGEEPVNIEEANAAMKEAYEASLQEAAAQREEATREYLAQVSKLLRTTDYVGELSDGIYLLLPNTESSDSTIVTERLSAAGVECEMVEA